MRYLFLLLVFTQLSCVESKEVERPIVQETPKSEEENTEDDTTSENNKSFPHDEIVSKRPFPQAETFENCIKPNHLSQDQLNEDVIEYYNYWVEAYVKKSNGVTPGGGFYVYMKGTGGDGNEITTSEAHGYGMIIFALMAGHDEKAKYYFDGMLNMYNEHRSVTNPHFMSWVIDKSEDKQYASSSATDGDMDIAYALLLADRQWGSDGELNYLQLAKDLINNGLKIDGISTSSNRVLLGDWDNDEYSTRSSDWMVSHFVSYYKVTSDDTWLNVANEAYSIMDKLASDYAPTTGLMPDFVVGSKPKPAGENYLNEYKETDEYNWNACRFPWRTAMGYIHYGDDRAKKSVTKILDFIIHSSDNHPKNIYAGYYLSGEPMVDYTSNAFTAPIITSSMVDSKYQNYLNDGWDVVKSSKYSYFGDTIGMLNLLLISGNWWAIQ